MTTPDVTMHQVLIRLRSILTDGERRGLWYDHDVSYHHSLTAIQNASSFRISFRITEHNERLNFIIGVDPLYYLSRLDPIEIVMRQFRRRMEEAYLQYTNMAIDWNQERAVTRNATWNQTPAQRAERAEQQRREVGRGDQSAANAGQRSADDFLDDTLNGFTVDRYHRFLNHTIGIGGGGPGGSGGSTHPSNWISNTNQTFTIPTQPPQGQYWTVSTTGPTPDPIQSEKTISESNLKEMLMALLRESLEIKFTLQESDGEIEAQVELFLDGEFITSDSDTIQL